MPLRGPNGPRSGTRQLVQQFPFDKRHVGYQDLIESRVAEGRMFRGPSAVWFRMRHPLPEPAAATAAPPDADRRMDFAPAPHG